MSFATKMWARRLATAARPAFTANRMPPALRPMRQWRGMAAVAGQQTIDNIPTTTITEDNDFGGNAIFYFIACCKIYEYETTKTYVFM